MELGGDGEPVWLIPHPRDQQPEEEGKTHGNADKKRFTKLDDKEVSSSGR